MMQAVTRTRSTAQWISLLEDKAVPCGPINDIGQAFADAQVRARGLVVTQPVEPMPSAHAPAPAITTISTVASPLRLRDTPPVLRRPPPRLGEHTSQVLTELGLGPAEISALRQRGVV